MNKFSLEPSKSPGLYHNRNASYDGPSISRQDMSRLSILSPKNFYESPDNSFYGATPMNAGMSARNSPLQMFSTLQNFYKQPLTAKASSLNRKELESLLYEYKGSGLASVIQKDKKGAPDTARIEAYFKIDYGNSGHKKHPNDDVEDVKRLDEWQMALKRQQVTGNIIKPNELLEQHQRREVKNRERDDFPKVKQELFDRIAANSDDEEEGKKMFQKERLPALLKDSKSLIGGAIGDFINDGFKNGAISLEVVQRENNKEILGDLINKKIKEEMKTINVGAMSDEQLRIHVKKVAEKVVVQFKTLKGPAGSLIVHNCVESTLKLLKLKRHDPEGFAAEFQKPPKNAENEVIADYEMMEDLLMEKFELCESDSEELRSKVKDLTIESYNIKKDLIALQAQLDAIEKKSVKALGDTAARDINRTSIKLMSTTNGRRASVKKSSNSKLALSKLEKHSEVLELSKKVHDAREKLVLKQQELQLQENELENIRGQMDYYKTQLRGLYYKCLKDDAALLRDSKNKKSYAWVIRSLWRIKEEVKDQAFPGYLDATSIKYLIDYAKSQNDLEEFCKQNNILNLVSNAEDLKVLNKKLDSGLPQETADDTTWTAENFDLMKLPRPQIKDLNTLLGDVHNQMAAFKRINLKAKRQVPIGRHGFKAKSIAYKWEDVDPTDVSYSFKLLLMEKKMDKVLTFQDQAISTFEGTEVHKIKKANHVEDHNKIVWDQGMEKLKAIFAMQKKELDRLIKLSLGKELDDRLRSSLQKALLFLFGRLGQESFIRFLREKTAYDQNVQGKAKKASLSSGVIFLNKPFSTSVPGSPTSISPSPQTNQFGNTFGSNMYQGEPLGYSNAMSRMNSTQADQQGFKTTKDSFAKFAIRTSSIGEMRTTGSWKP